MLCIFAEPFSCPNTAIAAGRADVGQMQSSYFRTPIMEKGNIMATTKESMKVIAGGLDKKEEPEVVMEGKVIAVEVPDELAEAFEKLVGGMITKCEDKGNLHSEKDQNDGGHAKDEDSEPTEVGTQKFSKKYRYVNDVPNSCKETITKVTSQDEEHYIVTPLRASVSEARLDAIYG